MREALKPLIVAKQKSEQQKKWVLPGTVSQAAYNKRTFEAMFKPAKEKST